MSTAPSLVLADDSALLREGLAGLLERQGYDVSVARDGQEALAFAAEPDAPLAEGYRLHLRDTQSCLMALGAAVTFRPDEAMHKTDDGAHDVD